MNDNEFRLALGGKIKKVRIDKNMSQTQLAAACGFDKGNMSKIEAGLTNPTILTLKKIVGALDVSLSELLTNV